MQGSLCLILDLRRIQFTHLRAQCYKLVTKLVQQVLGLNLQLALESIFGNLSRLVTQQIIPPSDPTRDKVFDRFKILVNCL